MARRKQEKPGVTRIYPSKGKSGGKRAGAGRPSERPGDPVRGVPVALPDSLRQKLDELAAKKGISRSRLVRQILERDPDLAG